MRTRWALLLALATFLGGTTGAVAQSAPGPRSLYGIRPGLAGVTTLEQGHFAFDVRAGDALDDAVVVSNFADQPMGFHLYPADMVTATGGAVAPAQESQPPAAVGAWIKLAQSTATVVPHGEMTVPFHVAVPEAAEPGDHLGAVVVALDNAPTAGGDINVQSRLALTVRVGVAGVLGSAVDKVEVGKVEHHLARGRREALAVVVRNRGRLLVTVDGHVAIAGGRVSLAPKGVYVIPGGRLTLRASGPKAPLLGRRCYQAVVNTHHGREPALRVSGPKSCQRFVPWIALTSATAGVAVLLALWLATRGRRRERREDRDIAKQIVDERRAARRRNAGDD